MLRKKDLKRIPGKLVIKRTIQNKKMPPIPITTTPFFPTLFAELRGHFGQIPKCPHIFFEMLESITGTPQPLVDDATLAARTSQKLEYTPLEILDQTVATFFEEGIEHTSLRFASVFTSAITGQTTVNRLVDPTPGHVDADGNNLAKRYMNQYPFYAWSVSTTLVLLLTCKAEPEILRPAANFLSTSGGDLTMKDLQTAPSADLPKLFTAAKKAAIDGKIGKTTVIAVHLVDAEFTRATAYGYAAVYPHTTTFEHAFAIGVSREGWRLYQSWGQAWANFRLDEWIMGGGTRNRTWEEGRKWMRLFERFVSKSGAWTEELHTLYTDLFMPSVLNPERKKQLCDIQIPRFLPYVRIHQLEDVVKADMEKFTWRIDPRYTAAVQAGVIPGNERLLVDPAQGSVSVASVGPASRPTTRVCSKCEAGARGAAGSATEHSVNADAGPASRPSTTKSGPAVLSSGKTRVGVSTELIAGPGTGVYVKFDTGPDNRPFVKTVVGHTAGPAPRASAEPKAGKSTAKPDTDDCSETETEIVTAGPTTQLSTPAEDVTEGSTKYDSEAAADPAPKPATKAKAKSKGKSKGKSKARSAVAAELAVQSATEPPIKDDAEVPAESSKAAIPPVSTGSSTKPFEKAEAEIAATGPAKATKLPAPAPAPTGQATRAAIRGATRIPMPIGHSTQAKTRAASKSSTKDDPKAGTIADVRSSAGVEASSDAGVPAGIEVDSKAKANTEAEVRVGSETDAKTGANALPKADTKEEKGKASASIHSETGVAAYAGAGTPAKPDAGATAVGTSAVNAGVPVKPKAGSEADANTKAHANVNINVNVYVKANRKANAKSNNAPIITAPPVNTKILIQAESPLNVKPDTGPSASASASGPAKAKAKRSTKQSAKLDSIPEEDFDGGVPLSMEDHSAGNDNAPGARRWEAASSAAVRVERQDATNSRNLNAPSINRRRSASNSIPRVRRLETANTTHAPEVGRREAVNNTPGIRSRDAVNNNNNNAPSVGRWAAANRNCASDTRQWEAANDAAPDMSSWEAVNRNVPASGRWEPAAPNTASAISKWEAGNNQRWEAANNDAPGAGKLEAANNNAPGIGESETANNNTSSMGRWEAAGLVGGGRDRARHDPMEAFNLAGDAWNAELDKWRKLNVRGGFW